MRYDELTNAELESMGEDGVRFIFYLVYLRRGALYSQKKRSASTSAT